MIVLKERKKKNDTEQKLDNLNIKGSDFCLQVTQINNFIANLGILVWVTKNVCPIYP